MIDVFATATEHLEHLRKGDYSAEELLTAHFDQIDKLDGEINAIVWQNRERALKQAREHKADDGSPLAGLSMTVKEAYEVSGSPTTWGIPEFKDNVTDSDALAVERLQDAGAIVFGKTNVPLQLSDLQSYNDIYGVCNNPWDPSVTCGGSSGGSGAALAAGYTALEMGSDIGGSIRTPAHFNGVFGHKPTWSLIPSRGHSLPGGLVEPDIAVIGPMARSAFDLELMLDVLAKPDAINPGLRYELAGLDKSLGELRVGVWANDDMAPVSKATEAQVRLVADALAQAGATVDYDARPDFKSKTTHDIYEPLLWSFMMAATPDDEYEELQAQAANLAPDANDRQSQMLRFATLPHRSWVQLHNAREGLRWAWHEFFQQYDVMLAPQTPTPAFPHDHRPISERSLIVDGVEQPYFDQIFWAGLIGISHLPSTVIPTGTGDGHLPIGIQIVGNAYSDRLTIQVAQQLERLGFAFKAPPRLTT